MIRKLQLKFVAICMALVTAVLAAVLLAVSASLEQNAADLSRQVLRRVLQESHLPWKEPDAGVEIGGDRVLLPYFTVNVWINAQGYTAYVTGGTYANLEDTEELAAILQDCLEQNQPEGMVKSYRLRYLRQDNGLYAKLAFVDVSMEEAMLHQMLRAYLGIALAGLCLLLGVSVLLARWATRPVERAWRQQRQFLSDASHELKTPLTVILSNAELLEGAGLESRPARWADNILSESRQMKSLVEQMLTLARADNLSRPAALEPVSLTELAQDCVLSFEPVAFEAGKRLREETAEGVTVSGSRDRLRQLIAILLDNAIKYGAEGGEITLILQRTDRQARLTVANPGPVIPPAQLERLFERFYRADASRGERSGFGLGLSIAAAIAAEHKGSLRAESDRTSTRFVFTVPLKKGPAGAP